MSVSKKPASTSTKSHAVSPAEAVIVATAPAAPPTPPTAPIASPPASPSPTPTVSLVSFPAPPPISGIPVPPAGFSAAKTTQFRGVLPYQAEETSLAAAIQDLGKIPNYDLFVGGPPLAQFAQILMLAGQWTEMRNASEKWDGYAATQEGNLWTSARPMMEEFRDAFAQAQKADTTLAAKLQGLVSFLGVKSVVAQKGASTKRANKQAEAAGERPTHGQVGKQRKRAAEKAALAAADASAETAPTGTVATMAASTGATGGAPANGATHS